MFKLEIKDQKANIQKMLEFFNGSLKINDYVMLERSTKDKIIVEADKSADGKSVTFTFSGDKPKAKIAGLIKGVAEQVVVTDESITVHITSLGIPMPAIVVPVVS